MSRITCNEGNLEKFQQRGWKEIERYKDPQGEYLYVFETDPAPETAPEPPKPKKPPTRFGG